MVVVAVVRGNTLVYIVDIEVGDGIDGYFGDTLVVLN